MACAVLAFAVAFSLNARAPTQEVLRNADVVVIAGMIRASARTTKSSTASTTTPTPANAGAADVAPASKATVYVYRPGKFMGKGLEPSVFLDEQKILDMDNGRYLTLHLDAGRHIVRSNEKNSEIDQTWEGGQTYYVKMTIAAGMMKGHGQMAMVTEKLAMKEMQELRPLAIGRQCVPVMGGPSLLEC